MSSPSHQLIRPDVVGQKDLRSGLQVARSVEAPEPASLLISCLKVTFLYSTLALAMMSRGYCD